MSENTGNTKSETSQKVRAEPEQEYETISYVDFNGKMITRNYKLSEIGQENSEWWKKVRTSKK